MILDGVDVEKNRARDVAGEIFAARVPVHGRQIERGVDHDDVGRLEVVGEPIGRERELVLRHRDDGKRQRESVDEKT